MIEPKEKIKEELLIVKAQLGDENSFVELVERYQPRLMAYIQRFVQDKDKSQDILQKVWLIVYRKLPKLRANKAFSVWIYRIARAQAIDMVREESRYVELTGDYDVPDVTGDTSEENEFTDEFITKVRQYMEKLKPEFKEVLQLRFMEEMSYDSIAEVIGCSTGTVKSRIYYAKQALKKEMEVLQHE